MPELASPAITPERPSPLHRRRMDAVRRALARSGARRIAELGCGRGPLLIELLSSGQIDYAVAVDRDPDALRSLSQRLPSAVAEVDLRLACFMDRRVPPAAVDAVLLIETIEHIAPSRLSAVEYVLFRHWRPRLVLLTTPNADYNPLLGAPPHRRRHWDHQFEWGRRRFAAWAQGCARRNNYRLALEDVGPVVPGVGGASQMALFTAAAASQET